MKEFINYLCHLLHTLCLVRYFDKSVGSNCSNRHPPTSKRKNCGPVCSEHAMSPNVWVAKFESGGHKASVVIVRAGQTGGMDQLTTHKKLTMQYVNEQPKIIDSTILRRMKVSKNALHMTGSRRNRAFSVAKRVCGLGGKKHTATWFDTKTKRVIRRPDTTLAIRFGVSVRVATVNPRLDPKTIAGERCGRRRRSKACRESRCKDSDFTQNVLITAVNIDKTTDTAGGRRFAVITAE